MSLRLLAPPVKPGSDPNLCEVCHGDCLIPSGPDGQDGPCDACEGLGRVRQEPRLTWLGPRAAEVYLACTGDELLEQGCEVEAFVNGLLEKGRGTDFDVAVWRLANGDEWEPEWRLVAVLQAVADGKPAVTWL